MCFHTDLTGLSYIDIIPSSRHEPCLLARQCTMCLKLKSDLLTIAGQACRPAAGVVQQPLGRCCHLHASSAGGWSSALPPGTQERRLHCHTSCRLLPVQRHSGGHPDCCGWESCLLPLRLGCGCLYQLVDCSQGELRNTDTVMPRRPTLPFVELAVIGGSRLPSEEAPLMIAEKRKLSFSFFLVIGLLYLTYPDGCWHESTFLSWQEGLPNPDVLMLSPLIALAG